MNFDALLKSLSAGSAAEVPRHELEAAAVALEELSRRRDEFPLYFFEPNPKLKDFHLSDCNLRMLAGGNRSGKTEHLVNEGCCNALGYRPWMLRKLGLPVPENPIERPTRLPREALCFDGAGVRIRIPNTILLGTGLDLKKGIRETIHQKVISFLGPEGGPLVKKVYWGHASTPDQVLLRNGSRIVYASALQKGLSWEATNYSWYGLDEPIPKRVYTGVRRGAIDQAAKICFSFTPLGQHAAWMFKDLYRHADSKRIETFNISIFENPWLSRQQIDDFVNDPAISDVEKEARLYGKFLHLVDRIYPQFDEEVHIVPDMRPERGWYVGHVIDPHTVKPWAMAWFAVTPGGDIVWFREWPSVDFTTLRRDTRSPKEYAQLIRQIEADRPADYRLVDPNYGPRKDIVRGVPIPSVKDVLADYGIFTNHDINDDLNYGEARVRALLTYDRNRDVSATNRPRMYFCESCQNLINGLLYYIAMNKSVEDDTPDEQKRDPTYKDFPDLIRYAAVSRAAEETLSDAWLESNLFAEANAGPDLPDYGVGYGEL